MTTSASLFIPRGRAREVNAPGRATRDNTRKIREIEKTSVGTYHEQASAAMVWTIDHNLGRWPIITIFDESGEEIHATITNPTPNRTTINFSPEPVAGSARLE